MSHKKAVRIGLYPRFEMIVITTKLEFGELRLHSPDGSFLELKQDFVTAETETRIRSFWQRLHSHGDFYFATSQITDWARSWPIDVMPDFDVRRGEAVESLMTLASAARNPHINRSRSTLASYAITGRVNPRTGKIVKLETVKGLTGRMVSIAAYKRFIEAVTVPEGITPSWKTATSSVRDESLEG